MSGCYGGDPEDRARERELDHYLDETYGEGKSWYEQKMERAEVEWERRRDRELEERS